MSTTTYGYEKGTIAGESGEQISEDDRKKIVALMLGSRQRRNRLRALLVTELVKNSPEVQSEEEEDTGPEAEDQTRKLAAFIIGRGIVRRRRLRRAILAAIVAHRGEEGVEEDEDGGGEEGFNTTLVRFLVGRGIVRRRMLRRAVRRALLSKLMGGTEEYGEDYGEDGYGEIGGGGEGVLARFLVGQGGV